ncbi:MAG: metallophosphoesterase [Bdellovibrionota bacterium]
MGSFRKSILHISDLHFGKIDDKVVANLRAHILDTNNKVDVVVVTGDLTQRARREQFIAAAKFLTEIQKTIPVVVIPGNHDVPLYNIFRRFLNPFGSYLKYIHPVLPDFYEDDTMIICGLWSNNIKKVADGRISSKELDKAKRILGPVDGKLKVVLIHHPLFNELPDATHEMGQRLRAIIELKPHLIMSGHEHQSSVKFLTGNEHHFPLLVSAGTGTSTRLREEPNSFNLICMTSPELKVINYTYDSSVNKFQKTPIFKNEFPFLQTL